MLDPDAVPRNERWPASTGWVLHVDGETHVWESTQEHRESRQYRP